MHHKNFNHCLLGFETYQRECERKADLTVKEFCSKYTKKKPRFWAALPSFSQVTAWQQFLLKSLHSRIYNIAGKFVLEFLKL